MSHEKPNLYKFTRLKLKMTQQEFADALGVKRGTVIQWEKPGAAEPSELNREKLNAFMEQRRLSLIDDPGLAASGVPRPTEAEPGRVYWSPIEKAFNEGAKEMRALLWRYTLSLSRAFTEQMEQAGPPGEIPPERATMFRDMLAQDAADKTEEVTPPKAAES